jgi:hypothetical protein
MQTSSHQYRAQSTRRAARLVALVIGFATISPALPVDAALCDGLVGWWSLDGDATDSSGNGNDGTIFGATPAADRLGIPEHSYSFNGTGDYIDIYDNGTLKPSLPISVGAWIKPNDGSVFEVFWNDFNAGPFYNGVIANVVGGNFWIQFGDGGFAAPESRRSKAGSTTLSPGTWYHVVGVIRGPTDMSVYVNGVDDGGAYSGSGGPLVYNTNPGAIGKGTADRVYYANGLVDDVFMFARALSAEDVAALTQGATCAGITTSTTTSTTTITTTTSTSSTSSTLPGDACDSEPVAATFDSIDCRLVALLARVNATSDLGTFGPKLANNIGRAKDDEEAGAGFCASSDLKRTRQQLKQAVRALIDYVHRLNGHAARKKLRELRQELVAAGEPIKADLKSLKNAVSCPANAPARH